MKGYVLRLAMRYQKLINRIKLDCKAAVSDEPIVRQDNLILGCFYISLVFIWVVEFIP